eukprot:6394245-Pyramimonas_sp.AAC.2
MASFQIVEGLRTVTLPRTSSRASAKTQAVNRVVRCQQDAKEASTPTKVLVTKRQLGAMALFGTVSGASLIFYDGNARMSPEYAFFGST